MPSFRRREEGDPRFRRPPAAGPRREAEEEEEDEPVRGSFRRPGGASSPWQREWASEPGTQARPMREPASRLRALVERIVPRSEQEDPYFKYGNIFFQVLSPAREGARPEAGPRAEPQAAAPQARRARRAQGGAPVVDPRNWFDDKAIYEAARRVRSDQRFKPGSPVALVQVAPGSPNEKQRAADLVKFFRIPKAEVDRYNDQTIWTELLHPFLDELSYAFDAGKPQDLPGSFGFQVADNPRMPPELKGSFWLGYTE